MRVVTLVARTVVIATLACRGHVARDLDHRYVNRGENYALSSPEGWKQSLDRGSTTFVPPTGKARIIVRSAPKLDEYARGKPATNEDIFAAIGRVLNALPRIELATIAPIEGSSMPSMQYDFRFAPPSGGGAIYRRIHVALVGSSHVFHIMYTAPISEAIDMDLVQSLVTSFEEV